VNQIGKCTTDNTGLIVTQASGIQFAPSWVGLQLVIGDQLSTIASVTSPKQMVLVKRVGPFSTPVPFAPNRETIYQAFFNLVSRAPGLQKASRTPRIFSDVDPSEKPFLFVEQMGENAQRQGVSVPYNWQLDISIGIYVYSPDPETVVPASVLNPILDSLEAMLAPSPTSGRQTLDGLVYEARLLGNGHEAAGAIGNNAWAYVPARIFAV
jgi:hypothetical protein